jgi:2-hydroxy-6-oxonona-2,4-dienedioate hydrolase
VRETGLRSDWSEVGGLAIHARASAWPVAPDAPVAVLVHGYVVSSAYMVPTARRLRPGWRVLAPDLPGFGASDHPARPYDVPELAGALAGWMRRQRLERVTLLGNSLGCQVVVDLAVRYPELVGELVLVGPTVDPAARSVTAQLGRLLRDSPRERPSLLALHARDWLRAGPAGILATIRHAVADRVEQKLPRVAAPTLVVVGARDPLVPRPWAERATGLLPRGRLVVVPGAPHALNYSAPDALVRAMVGAPPRRPARALA